MASVADRCTVVSRRPSRITEMRSQIASTSRTLCEMNTMLVPSATMTRREAKVVHLLRRQVGRRFVEISTGRLVEDLRISTR